MPLLGKLSTYVCRLRSPVEPVTTGRVDVFSGGGALAFGYPVELLSPSPLQVPAGTPFTGVKAIKVALASLALRMAVPST